MRFGGIHEEPNSAADVEPGEGHSTRRVFAFAAAGLSVASLAFGVFEHLSWQNKVRSFGDMSGCGSTFPDRGGAGCQELFDGGSRARLLAFVAYGAGAALGATALILFLTDSGRGSQPDQGTGKAAGTLACAPIPMTTAALGCALRF